MEDSSSGGETPNAPFANTHCVYNICCGVCRHNLNTHQQRVSFESISGLSEFSGFARYLASPIDDHDPDSSSILGRKYKDMYAARKTVSRSLKDESCEGHDIHYKRPICIPPESLELIVWIDFPRETVEKLMTLKSFLEVKEYISQLFNLNDLKDVLKMHIVTDLYSYGVQFGRVNALNVQQMSTFLGIIKRVHERNIATPFTNVDHCFDYCKELILLHSVHRPPFWADIFTKDIAEIIIQYMVATYFKHFRLYKNAFTDYVVLNAEVAYLNEFEEDVEETLPSEENITRVESAYFLEQ